jgi:hypothetical protein
MSAPPFLPRTLRRALRQPRTSIVSPAAIGSAAPAQTELLDDASTRCLSFSAAVQAPPGTAAYRRLNGQVETLKAKVVDLQLRVDTSCPITTPALHQQVNLLGAENLTLKRLLKVERSKKVQLQN